MPARFCVCGFQGLTISQDPYLSSSLPPTFESSSTYPHSGWSHRSPVWHGRLVRTHTFRRLDHSCMPRRSRFSRISTPKLRSVKKIQRRALTKISARFMTGQTTHRSLGSLAQSSLPLAPLIQLSPPSLVADKIHRLHVIYLRMSRFLYPLSVLRHLLVLGVRFVITPVYSPGHSLATYPFET